MGETFDLLKYISVDRLQGIQDSFSALLGVAAGISDENGSALTQHSRTCDFCKYTRVSRIGEERCRKCDSEGSEQAFQKGAPVAYTCHAGLVDFVAPIVVDGKRVGAFAGGQVRLGEPDEEKVRKTAKDIGVNPEMYLALARRTTLITEDDLKKAMDFIHNVTQSISDMAYQQYQLEQAKIEVEYAAKLKADFLANMSHEIRTPMNGVIGMAELALREELPPAAREYLNQIKVSGKTLLTIINDILDFSKIESGKMDLVIDEYEPLSIVNDVANVILTRIGDKKVELILDVDVNLPSGLLGDNIRIKQILLNLANNAVKFTEIGRVLVRLGYQWNSEDEIELKVSVEDTGIGIAEENLKKLFQSFQQVDSKRNRQVEGTGLGLAIAKQLVEQMGGEIGVDSVYGEGSTFWFHIPQKVCKPNPSIQVKDAEKIYAVSYVENMLYGFHLKTDLERLGVRHTAIENIDLMTDEMLEEADYLFLDDTIGVGQIETIANLHPQLTVVQMIGFKDRSEFTQKNIVVLRKPIYALNLANLFNHTLGESHLGTAEDENFVFVAPDAHILIVDDNAVNLTVAQGLLRPLKMQIDTAFGGKDAIEKISHKKYDLIFMDHMMPEIDGVEATRLIRRFHPEYNEVPIIALTANVVEGTRDMFIREGMNDFVAKPIEIKTIVSKLHKWLPAEKQFRVGALETGQEEVSQPAIQIDGLDTKYAMKLLGSEKLYRSVLKDYYRVIDKKAALIRELYETNDWGNYTIEVHALKSASRQIGALELADRAAEMERAGNARDIAAIRDHTEEMLEKYLGYKAVLQPICEERTEKAGKPDVEEHILRSYLTEFTEAIDNLDMDEMDRIMRELAAYSYDEERQELIDGLQNSVDDLDVDACSELVQKLLGTLI